MIGTSASLALLNLRGSSDSSYPMDSHNTLAASAAMAAISGSTGAYPRSADHNARSPRGGASAIPASSVRVAGDSCDILSTSSRPDMTSMSLAVSSAVHASTETVFVSDDPSARAINPWVGFKPTKPQKAAGERTDPPLSDPVAKGTIPAETAAADPPLLPPGVFVVAQGFRVMPKAGDAVIESRANSGVAVLPMGTAPARRSLAMLGSSFDSGFAFRNASDPCIVGIPAQFSTSLTPKGPPASGPGSPPRSISMSIRFAHTSAPGQSRYVKALSRSLSRSTRLRHSSSSSRAEIRRLRTPDAISITVSTEPSALRNPIDPRFSRDSDCAGCYSLIDKNVCDRVQPLWILAEQVHKVDHPNQNPATHDGADKGVGVNERTYELKYGDSDRREPGRND